jgi:hypothetical protein
MIPRRADRSLLRHPAASAFLAADADSGPIYNVTRPRGYRGALPSDQDAAAALKAPAVEICPVCRVLLPDNWRQGHAICVAITVSALGQPPAGKRLNTRGIAPFRCTDPLRWVTSAYGLL